MGGRDVGEARRIADRVEAKRAAREALRLPVEIVDAAQHADVRALRRGLGVDVAPVEGAVAVRDQFELHPRRRERRQFELGGERVRHTLEPVLK